MTLSRQQVDLTVRVIDLLEAKHLAMLRMSLTTSSGVMPAVSKSLANFSRDTTSSNSANSNGLPHNSKNLLAGGIHQTPGRPVRRERC